jgi:protein-disulfide isomerase
MQRKIEPTILVVPVNSTDHILGPASATVTVIEYGDFECPYCGAAYPAVKILLKRSADRVRFVFRHFPLVEAHPHADRAAEAAEAAGAQDKFWRMHDLLFENQRHLEIHDLRRYASQAELDLKRYDTEMSDRIYRQAVQEDVDSGKRSGARTMPAFFVNGVIEDVSFGMEQLYQAIETKLRATSANAESSYSPD